MPERSYHLWLEPLEARELRDGTLTVVGAPEGRGSWAARRYTDLIRACAASVLGHDVEVKLVSGAENGGGRTAPALDDVLRPPASDWAPNPKYTFEQFVIGEGNRLAHAAALAVAEQPGHAYNPLFLYGPPGTGKTHLLHAIANYALRYGEGLEVRCTTVESFTNDFLDALRTGGTERFKARYRRADILLIDDVQFLEHKARTEEEFFHTFNALYETGSQLVLTSDRRPRDMAALEARLRERFESGLLADISPPDFRARLAILRKRALHDGIAIEDPGALELIADRVRGNVRTLESALIRVVAHHSLTGRPITSDLVAEVLEHLHPAARAPRSIRDVQDSVAHALGVTHDDLVSARRSARVVWPRHVAMYLARELTGATLPAIGRQFGNRNHATVLHACRTVQARIAEDSEAAALIDQLRRELHRDGSDRPG